MRKHYAGLALAACVAVGAACSSDDTESGADPSDPPGSVSTEVDNSTPAVDSTEPAAAALDPDATIRTIGAAPPPGTWDPANTNNPSQDTQYFTFVYDTLLRLSDDGSDLEPLLATGWEYDETGTVLTLTLRDDVTFTDGAAFDATVARDNLERVRSGTGGAARLLQGIESIEAASPTELVITQTTPTPKVIYAMASGAAVMVSPDAIADPDSLTRGPVGSGPYTVDRADATSVTFVRKDDYWNADNDPVYAARHIVTGATDSTARINAVLSGDADLGEISQQIPTPDLLAAEEAGTLQISTVPGSPSAYGINNTIPPFDDPRVILAVNHAIDRDEMNEVIYDGLCEPIGNIFLPGKPGYIEDQQYEYDPELARELLAEAGITEEITVKFQSVASGNTAPIDLLANQLAEVGINLEITQSSIQDVLPNFFTGQFAMSILPIFIGMPDSSYTTDYLVGIQNPGTKDPELVALVDAANALAPDDPGRDAAYEAVSEYVFEHPVMIPNCLSPHTMIARPEVVGLENVHDNMGGRYARLGVTG